jgi:hypothetical protein
MNQIGKTGKLAYINRFAQSSGRTHASNFQPCRRENGMEKSLGSTVAKSEKREEDRGRGTHMKWKMANGID